MKKDLLKYILLFSIVALLLHFNFGVYAQFKLKPNLNEEQLLVAADTAITGVAPVPEKKLKYTRSLLNNDFDFSLKPTAQGKFSLSFFNNTNEVLAIKVYDIIGNLIFTEHVNVKGNFVKEYDLSFYKTELFVVEVGNAKYNKTKSIVAV